MATFKSYPKVHRLNKEEVEGILIGDCHIEEKIDGANTSIWVDKRGEIACGSRNRELQEGFNGFVDYVKGHRGIQSLLADHPTYRLYGEWLCLSGDTVIKKVSGGKGGNGNYMTLKQMYDYLHTPTDNRVNSWWQRYGMPLIYSLNPSEGRVLPNRIKRIEKTGVKMAFLMKTRLGFEIKSSADHKFLTPGGYVELSSLAIGDVVGISQVVFEQRSSRRLMSGSRGIQYQHKKFLQDSGVCSRCGGTDRLELDHIDNDWLNNDTSNFQALCKSCHSYKSKEDGVAPAHTKGYSYFFDNIISIENVGEEEMYDIEMEGTEELANFVANNFIVHNCRHTIQYNETSYKQFYLFDIAESLDGAEPESFFPREVVIGNAKRYEINHPQQFGMFTNPSVEQLQEFVGKSSLGAVGEGIVIKNESFVDKWGNHNYGKLVSEKFKEDNAITFGGNNKSSESYWEMYVVNKYMTLARVQKIMHKIEPQIDSKLDFIHTPRVANTAWYDMLTEEINEIANKVESINFKKLKTLATRKAIQIYHDILNNSISVADL